MRFKKIILYLILIFSIVSLFVILYFSKNRIGLFGKIYDNHIKKTTEIITLTLKNNLETVNSELKSVAEENVVNSIFQSFLLNIPPVDSSQLIEIKNKIPDCLKIQLVTGEGLIIYSTEANEAFSQKIKTGVMEKIENHFVSYNTPFIYFLNNDQFVATYPVKIEISNTVYNGFLCIYYNIQKLTKNLSKKLKVPFSIDKFMFLSKTGVDIKDVNYIIQNYETLQTNKGENFEKTIGGIAQFDGVKVVYYAKNEKFVSPVTIIFLLIDLILLLLVIFTLFQLEKEKKLYQKIALSSLKTDTQEESEIGSLVRDIEEEKTYERTEAEKGIEEMIMHRPVDLTKTLESEEYETMVTKTPTPFSEKTESYEITEPQTPLQANIEEELPVIEKVQPVETYEHIKPSKEDELLAEQEKLLEAPVEKIQQEKDFTAEPPKKISTIATIEDYGNVALDLCQNNLDITKIAILKKENSHFKPIIVKGFKTTNLTYEIDDPLIKLFFVKGKFLEIKGNLDTRYLNSKFLKEDLENLEGLLAMPIVKKNEIVGLAFYGRESKAKEITNFQKFELFNLGYLQSYEL